MALRWALALLLLAPAVLVFAPGLRHPFVALDDLHYVVHNPAIRDLSWDGIRHLFFGDTRDLRYFPVSYLSFAIDYRIAGLDASHYHLVNLLLHLANTLLVARLVGRVFGDAALGFWTALLFSLHPLQVESVAWVMSRKNVLFLLFFLLAALAYVAARERAAAGRAGSRVLLAASALVWLVACLAKTAALPLPVALLLVDFVRDPQTLRRPLAFLRRHGPSKLAYLPPLAVVLLAAVLYEAPNPFRTDFGFDTTEWIAILAHNLVWYLVKTVAPLGLAPFHPIPEAGALPASFWLATAAAPLLLAGTALALWRGQRVLGFGLGWYLATIAPNAAYPLVFEDLPILVADRYFYQSAIGVLLLPAAAGLWLWRTWPGWRAPLAAGAGCVLLALGLAASAHRANWRSTAALYRRVLAEHPNDEFAYRLALEEAAAGRMTEAFAALEAAERAPRRIFFLDFLYYRFELARLYLAKGDLGRAADQVEAALHATPNAYEPFDARTPLAFRYLADLRARAGDAQGRARALAAAERAPRAADDEFAIAFARLLPDEARGFLARRVHEAPGDAEAWRAYGIVAELAGDARSARERFARAERAASSDAAAGAAEPEAARGP